MNIGAGLGASCAKGGETRGERGRYSRSVDADKTSSLDKAPTCGAPNFEFDKDNGAERLDI